MFFLSNILHFFKPHSTKEKSNLFNLWHKTCIASFHSIVKSDATKRLITVIKKNDDENDIANLQQILSAIKDWQEYDKLTQKSTRGNHIARYSQLITNRIKILLQINARKSIHPHHITFSHFSESDYFHENLLNFKQKYSYCFNMAFPLTLESKEFHHLYSITPAKRVAYYNKLYENLSDIRDALPTHSDLYSSSQLSDLSKFKAILSNFMRHLDSQKIKEANKHHLPYLSGQFKHSLKQRLKSFILFPASSLLVDLDSIIDSMFTLCPNGLY